MQLLGHGFGFFRLERALRLFDEREHIAHAKNTPRHAFGVEHLEIGKLFTDADILDRSARHRLDGQGRAAAGIAVHLGQDHAGQGQILVEGFGHGHGILTGHGVGHEQNFLRLYGGLDVHQLLHEQGVDVQAARRIEDDHGALLLFGVFERGADNVHGLHIRRRSKAGDVELPGERAELIDGGGTVHVHGNEIRPHFLLAQEIGELARRCGLTGTLKAHHHDDAGLRAAQVQFGCFAAEQGNEFVMHSFDELLRGGQAFFDFLAEHALTHALHELLDDLEVDVGFQQGKTHLAQAIADIFLGELRPAAQGAERAGQPVR